MSNFEIFKEILNDPIDINPVKHYTSSIIVNDNSDIISNLRFEICEVSMRKDIYYCEYIKNLEKIHEERITKLKNYLYFSFEICEKIKQKYESEIVLRNQNKNK